MSAAVPSVRSGDRSEQAPPAPEAADSPPGREPDRGRWPRLVVAALFLVIVALGLWIRLRNNGYGLPYVYNFDEAEHFTNRAVHMFGGNLDPMYYQNPSGLTYLLYGAFRLWYGVFGIQDLPFGQISKQFHTDPTPLFEFARTLTALLAMAGVVGLFFVARRLWGSRVGLVAASLLCFSFLSVTYSRIAVTDVGTFLPVAIAVWGIFMVWERGKLLDYAVAGAAIGFAVGFKYTAGLALLPLLIAAGARWWRDKETPWFRRRDLRYMIVAVAALAVCFGITTPFFYAHPVDALYQLKQQAEAAGASEKLGQGQQGGLSYYLESFTWGFGWAAIAAAVVGAVFEFRRNKMRALLLVSFPVVLFLYMGVQTRYFGRWLLMIYPILAILAGIGIVRTAELVRGRSARWGWALSGGLAALITVLVLIQPVAADVRTSNVLGRADTRDQAKAWLVARYPDSLRTVIEPAVPDIYYRKEGKANALRNRFVRGFVNDIRRQSALDSPAGADTTYAATLRPELLDLYRSQGFCVVMTTSLIRGRAENAKLPRALAYYDRLERDSRHILHLSPYKKGRGPVPLHYDFSYDYYPTAYHRPGGVVDVYRLNDCKQKTGRVPKHPYGTRGLRKGIGTSVPSR
jgi:MFS family permease